MIDTMTIKEYYLKLLTAIKKEYCKVYEHFQTKKFRMKPKTRRNIYYYNQALPALRRGCLPERRVRGGVGRRESRQDDLHPLRSSILTDSLNQDHRHARRILGHLLFNKVPYQYMGIVCFYLF